MCKPNYRVLVALPAFGALIVGALLGVMSVSPLTPARAAPVRITTGTALFGTVQTTNLTLNGTALTATATQLNRVGPAFGTVAFDRGMKVAKVALAAVDSGGGVFAWQNPESSSVLVQRVILDVTTNTSGSCTLDVGTTASSATTSSDNLIDGLSLASAAQVADNLGNAGSNGKTRQKLATGKWVTGSVASGASAGVVGYAYIHYIVI